MPEFVATDDTLKLDAYTLRQTRATARVPAPFPAPEPPAPELTEAQKARLQRQQQFREAFGRLENLLQDMRVFSVQHHYFKESTKIQWMNALEDSIEGMRAFLPKESPSPDKES